jgi:drug/metabolite transporter (DMT)-like permease
MKKMHEYTSATYAVITSIFFFGLGIPISGSKTIISTEFDSADYIVMIFAALCGIAGLVCKTKAMQLEMASRLSILIYFSVIFSLVFDLLLIGTVFNSNEIYGMIVIFMANALSVYVIFAKFYKNTEDKFVKK